MKRLLASIYKDPNCINNFSWNYNTMELLLKLLLKKRKFSKILKKQKRFWIQVNLYKLDFKPDIKT